MRARFGRMINPLCEKTRSTGEDDAGTQNTYSNNGFSCRNLVHTLDMDMQLIPVLFSLIEIRIRIIGCT